MLTVGDHWEEYEKNFDFSSCAISGAAIVDIPP